MWTAAAVGSRFRLDNVRAALGEPGDGFHDAAAGSLICVPMAGEQRDSDLR